MQPELHSPRLRSTLAALWPAMVDGSEGLDRYGLIPELPFDAAMARARGDDQPSLASPRLLTLMVDGALSKAEAVEVVEWLAASPWTDEQRERIIDVLDAWWFQTLLLEPGEHPEGYDPDLVLGLLARSGARMSRWLHVWLTEIDGPPAVHLASAVIDRFPAPTWNGRPDERAQVIAWARSEPVVNGLALVGAPHLDAEMLSRALDILIGE